VPDDELRERLARAEAEVERLQRRERHFIAAQRISHVGSYDFEIATNTNEWSDQLYRIYGREPQSFNASYERFLEMVHPDDREKIIGVHQEALATISPYEMEERIVWPDGQVRTLASWGEVVADADGNPARMIGICWDITEQKAQAEALQKSSERFQQVIQSAPDVVLVVSRDGTVVRANPRLADVFGWSPDDLRGQSVDVVLPGGVAAGETTGVHRDGRAIPVDISTSEVELDDALVTVAFLRDATHRKQNEELALRVHDNEARRRHALEINDNVVQGLASVLYLMDLERYASAHAAARQTLASARARMSDLLAGAEAALEPGQLVREQGHAGLLDDLAPPTTAPRAGALRVLLADDAADIRLLLRFALDAESGFEVVGEAANGLEAVELAATLQPDLVVLDLSMPVMDGLQAIPELLRVAPATRIVVLSGFDEARMKQVALDLGAHGYLEKGSATTELVSTLAQLFPAHALGTAVSAPPDPESSGGLAFDGDMVVHELRTPLTVITGMLATLRDRMDVLPSATTAELIAAALRNAAQMAELLQAVSDARRASHGELSTSPEPTDIGALVTSAVSDLCAGHNWRPAEVTAPLGVVAEVDPGRIRQVLANLLSNAYKFSPPGSPVRVTVAAADGRVEISVCDEGPGVPPERRGELFQKFARLGGEGTGMGLGLFISRAIARAHGGDLTLSEHGKSTFTVSLPLASRRLQEA
jgi:PAS domain S-box-containing protein